MSGNPSFKRKVTKEREFSEVARGFELKPGITLAELPELYANLGYQGTNLARACEILREAKKDKAEIFLTFTSNIVSCGLREIVAQLCREKVVAGIITSTGSIEEDFMKTQGDFYVGSFDVDDELVKKQGMNRIGNVFVPDEAYVNFEAFNTKVLQEIYDKNKTLVPSEYCKLLGSKINDPRSFLYWAARNGIPVYAPGFVDGAIGDHIFYFNQEKKQKLVVDQAADIDKFYKQMLCADKTAGLIIGGGIAKHHLIGAAILRSGLDYLVYVSTGSPGDGSLTGARPTEAVSWSKLKNKKKSVLVEGEATLSLPIIATALLF